MLVSRPAVGPVGTTQTLVWPNSCVCCPQNPQLPELDHFHLWEHSLSTQIFHRCRVYLADHGDLICSLYSWCKGFWSSSLVTLSLWFSFGFIPMSVCGPPTGVWYWGFLGDLGSAPCDYWAQRWYDCLDHGSTSAATCTGKQAAMGTRGMALERAFSGAQHKVREGQPWPGFFWHPAAGMQGPALRGLFFFNCPSAGTWGPALRGLLLFLGSWHARASPQQASFIVVGRHQRVDERGYNSGSSPCVLLSSSALLPWQSSLPP